MVTTPSLPNTSSAVNIQIFSPQNFPNGATPGQIPGQQAPGLPGQQAPDAFQRSTPAGGNPQQQLQDAYQQARNSRNAAEQSRQSYLNLANQLNGQPQQANPFGSDPNAFGQPPQPQLPQQDPMAQWQAQQQQAQLQQQMQQQQAAQQQQQQAAQQQQQQAEQQAQLQQQQQAEQAAQQQAAEQAAQQQQQPPQPQGLAQAPVEELNRMIAQPQTLQEKVDAMEEVGVRGQGTPETYELLKQEAMSDTSALPPGQSQDDANYIRQAALWTLGMLNKAQNANVPTASLPGLNAIEQIIGNRNENPDVKAAAIQALQVIDRPQDKQVAGILKKASKDKNPDVKRLASEALSGKAIPLPGGAAPQGGPQGPAQDPFAGMDPNMLAQLGLGGAPQPGQ